MDLRPLLSSQVTVVNLAEQPVSVSVTLLDTESTGEFRVGSVDLFLLQVTTQLVLPTRFRLDFDFPGGGDADAGTCTIDVADKEQLVFAVIAKGIAMTSSGPEPVAAAEMLVATSSRCRVGGRA